MDRYELVRELRDLRDKLIDALAMLREFVERSMDHVHDLYEVSVKIDEVVNKLDRLVDAVENPTPEGLNTAHKILMARIK